MALPDYSHPPVVEVVCGVTFKPLKALLGPHLGLIWQQFQDEYPQVQEVPPLTPVIEGFEGEDTAQLSFSNVPPLPRVWFVHGENTGIVQIQRDRFLHNWKKASDTDAYPRYPQVIELFKRHLGTFETFVETQGLGPVEPIQYELTYVNLLPKGEGWSSFDDMHQVFSDFAWKNDSNRFLPTPDAFNWHTTFCLPDKLGRLHVSIQSHSPNNEDVIKLQLMVRGLPSSTSEYDVWQWFDTAREWIVRGFADLGTEEIQNQVWRRKA